MKKMAVFVEGQTEAIFVKELLKEIAGVKNIIFEEYEISGGKYSNRIHSLKSSEYYKGQRYIVNIYNSGTDNRVVSDVRDNLKPLQNQAFSKVLGILDVYPKKPDEIQFFRDGIKFALQNCLIPVSIILSIMEVEAWFLSEINHFEKIDPLLTADLIKKQLGIDILNENMEERIHPSEDLKQIYRLVGKSYTKSQKHIERTVSVLDYSNIYLELKNKVPSLREFIDEIDNFLDLAINEM